MYGSPLPSVFLKESNIIDLYVFVNCFAHIVYCQGPDWNYGQGLLFYTCPAFAPYFALNFDSAIYIIVFFSRDITITILAYD